MRLHKLLEQLKSIDKKEKLTQEEWQALAVAVLEAAPNTNSADVLVALVDIDKPFSRALLSNDEVLMLSGRSLSVVGELLDGVSVDQKRASSPPVRLMARLGAAVVMIARVLTPGSLHGSLFRHLVAVVLTLDLLLVILSAFNHAFAAVAVTVTTYVVLAIAIMEFSRLAVYGSALWRRLLFAVLGLFLAFVGIAAIAFTAWKTVQPEGGQNRAPKHFLDATQDLYQELLHGPQGTFLASFCLAAAGAFVLGIAWSRVISRTGRGHPVETLLHGLLVLLPFAVFGALLAAFAYFADRWTEPQLQLVAAASLATGWLFFVSDLIRAGFRKYRAARS